MLAEKKRLIRPRLIRPTKKQVVPPTPEEIITANGGVSPLPRLAGGAVSGNAFVAQSAQAELATENTARTVLQLIATTTSFDVCEMSVSCNGTTGFLLIELLTGSNATNETEATAITPAIIRGGVESQKALSKAFGNYTAGKEPTVLTVVKTWNFPLPMAPFILPSALGREAGNYSLKAAAAGISLAIRLTATASKPKVSAYFEFEE